MTRLLLIISLSMLLGMNLISQSWPSGMHDPSSIVKCDDTYWVFGTGEGIYARYSTDLLTWSDGPSPFPYDFPSWILDYATTASDAFDGFFWAPDIIYMNNKYYLYYSCSVWGTMNSCIGVVVNKTLDPADPDFQWVDQGDIGIHSSGGHINAIDPSVMRGHDGKVWLTYGSFNRDGIVVTEIDQLTGKPLSSTPTSIANSYTGSGWYGEGEGGCLVHHEGYYYLFYNKGGCCNGIASSYYMVMGRSENPQGPYYDKAGKPMRLISAPSGGTVVFKHDDSRGLDDRYFGPGHFGLFRENGVDYVSFHYYDPNGYYPSEEANFKGGPTLGLAKLVWGEDGWPEISLDFLDEGYYIIENSNSGKVVDLQQHLVADNSLLYQYAQGEEYETQKWLFTPLGTGEYTIRSYADHTLYVRAAGTTMGVTSNYTGAINQKFRLVQAPDQQLLIYPSTEDLILEVPNASLGDTQLKLRANTNNDGQRWYATPFIETLSVSLSNIVMDHNALTIDTISIQGNGSWEISLQDSSWIDVTPTSGTGAETIIVALAENPFVAYRTNQINILSKAGKTLNINVIQQGNPMSAEAGIHALDLDIYPNPVRDWLTIQTVTPGVTALEMASLNGKLVYRTSIQGGTHQIDMTGFSQGVYFITLRTKDMVKTMKIIKTSD